MRARFTGLKYKDPQFLAATEKDPSEETTIKKRAEGWKITLGLEKAPELSFWEKLLGGEEASASMQEPISFELIEADEDEVEFKMNFADGTTLHERSTMMRARFTGLKYKDPQFLAATEKDPSEETTIKKRAEGWKITLGLEKAPELSFWDKLFGEGEAVQSMQEPISFELIEADEDEVEFKMNFADGMTLHERSTFNEDRKWGYVFSGESEFADWFETPKK
eukprot:CAMPEP_0197703212 /NCGR_PEP_ID=MMETSP1338-20131121/125325_1 /TAXON_ID=43686 ORGANISM="Pelagodinium beii, Strain RCC1491" /NCGR_SAMPLE_ID=MMETSP1338 /ASSEMBLY_ACC=CAM_ASM_000754 /LENGTH=221 /DNA_ID=CAMNT_0043287105 /DNA_START=18 /DNA_END=683 /DNA_ORIENTATION=-